MVGRDEEHHTLEIDQPPPREGEKGAGGREGRGREGRREGRREGVSEGVCVCVCVSKRETGGLTKK